MLSPETSTNEPSSLGFMRLDQILEVIPIGKTRWYEGVKKGEFPSPVALGRKIKLYRRSDINELIEQISSGSFSFA